MHLTTKRHHRSKKKSGDSFIIHFSHCFAGVEQYQSTDSKVLRAITREKCCRAKGKAANLKSSRD